MQVQGWCHGCSCPRCPQCGHVGEETKRPKGDNWPEVANEWGEAIAESGSLLRSQNSQGFRQRERAAPGAVLPTNEWPLPSLPTAPVSAFWSWGDIAAAASLFRHPVPSLCPPPPRASVLWLELCEAEDNLGLISVPGRHVTCVAGTQTARVLAANSSREKTEELSHLITGNGPLCVCDSVRLSDRF